MLAVSAFLLGASYSFVSGFASNRRVPPGPPLVCVYVQCPHSSQRAHHTFVLLARSIKIPLSLLEQHDSLKQHDSFHICFYSRLATALYALARCRCAKRFLSALSKVSRRCPRRPSRSHSLVFIGTQGTFLSLAWWSRWGRSPGSYWWLELRKAQPSHY